MPLQASEVSLAGFERGMLFAPVTLGVALGLVIGKQIGVFGLTLAAVKLGLAKRPAHASLPQLYGLSLLCGAEFTMSLFIGLLAFADWPNLRRKPRSACCSARSPAPTAQERLPAVVGGAAAADQRTRSGR